MRITMETNKKDYLFKLGPVLFFPKDKQPKPPPYQDSFEEYRNIIRLLVICWYSLLSFLVINSIFRGDEFEELTGRSTWFYVVLFIPLGVSLIDVYLVWLEWKTGIPMKRISKILIYGSWIVSAIYSAIMLYGFLLT
jgi:hypothetical protein